jgi:hypothetical protein
VQDLHVLHGLAAQSLLRRTSRDMQPRAAIQNFTSMRIAVQHVELEGDLGDGLVVLTAEWEKFRRNVLEHVCTEALGLPGELDPELDDDNVV